MNNEEAIKELERENKILASNGVFAEEQINIRIRRRLERNNLASEALKKQTPQKPKRSGKYGVCPSCSRIIERYEQKHGNIEIPHCKWCGKKLDWSDTE